GIWAGVGGVALPSGPLLGGALVQTIGWRSVFLINVPIVLAAVLAVRRVVPPTSGGAGSRLGRARLDRAGVLTGGLALAVGTFAVIETGHRGLDAPVLVAFAVAGLLLVGFVLVERSRPDPMLPLGLFARPAFSVANAVAAVMNLGTLGLLFVLTLYLQAVQGRSALAAGVALLPLFLPLTVLAPIAGRFTSRIGPKPVMAAGLLTAAIGVALMARLAPSSDYLVLLPALLCWGIGLGMLTPAVVAAAVGAVEPARAGLASGVNNTARQAGGAIGIAVFGAVAGSAVDHDHFVRGLHLTALGTAGLFVVAALATLALVPAAERV
ncbi:MAG: MFS transporter, partial [Actinomycetota bacterium]|nr:MFS transporter [Actinomycetota bacterium]